MRKFDEWWNSVPADLKTKARKGDEGNKPLLNQVNSDLKTKARKGDEGNKPLLNQVNYVLLHLHLAGKHDAKPSHDELKDWLHSGQVDVLRMNK